MCCQDDEKGGLMDKPGKGADFYHTSYSLARLSLCSSSAEEIRYARAEIKLGKIDPVFNVMEENLKKAKEYFKKL